MIIGGLNQEQRHLLHQIGGRECLLDSEGPRRGDIQEVMTRCEVLCTLKPPTNFKGAKDQAIKVRLANRQLHLYLFSGSFGQEVHNILIDLIETQ